MNKSKKKPQQSTGNTQNSLSTESEKYDYGGQSFDRLFHALISQLCNWLSPGTLMMSFTDWLYYLT